MIGFGEGKGFGIEIQHINVLCGGYLVGLMHVVAVGRGRLFQEGFTVVHMRIFPPFLRMFSLHYDRIINQVTGYRLYIYI